MHYGAQMLEGIVESAGIMDDSLESLLLLSLTKVEPNKYFQDISEEVLLDPATLYSFAGEPLPSLLLRMMSLTQLKKGSRVLELSPVSGFSTSLFSSIGAYVFSVYREVSQAQKVRKLLDGYGYQNALIRTGESQRVWNEHAPFDCIFQYHPVEELPFELLEMLSPEGGTLVAILKESGGARLYTWQLTPEGLKTTPLESIEITS